MDGAGDFISTKRLTARSLAFGIVRELTEHDLIALQTQPVKPRADEPSQLTIRHAHHRLAECIVQGMEIAEAAMVTGYSPGYITRLKSDPTFEELLAHYDGVRKQQFVDAVERMKMLGLMAMEEIQERLSDDPADFTKRELQEIIELCLIKGQQKSFAGPGGNPAGNGGVAVNVSFVTATPVELKPIVELIQS